MCWRTSAKNGNNVSGNGDGSRVGWGWNPQPDTSQPR